MSRDRTTQFVDAEMSDTDVDDLLRTAGYGIVSLCEDGEPYSVPVSFGYDGESLYIPFVHTEAEATKSRFIGPGQRVRLLVTDIRDRYDWQSVAVTGDVTTVDPESEEWDHFVDTLVANGWFDRGFEASTSAVAIDGWKLEGSDSNGVRRRPISYD